MDRTGDQEARAKTQTEREETAAKTGKRALLAETLLKMRKEKG